MKLIGEKVNYKNYMRKLLIYFIAVIILYSSCASNKEFKVDGETILVEPYGWANKDTRYNENVLYEVNIGNVIWSFILVETIIIPVWLTGWELFEPIKLKQEKK